MRTSVVSGSRRGGADDKHSLSSSLNRTKSKVSLTQQQQRGMLINIVIIITIKTYKLTQLLLLLEH